MEKIIQGVVEKYLKNNAVIDQSHHAFRKRKSYFNNIMSFHYEVTHLVEERKAVRCQVNVFTKTKH